VVRRTRYASQLGRDEWSLPKGHLRGDESSVDAALREVEEETGWRCVVLSEAGALRYRTEKEGPKEGSRRASWCHNAASVRLCDLQLLSGGGIGG
jgi:8-oxo-dGTP pyrophosphatase MutT (NUDIX family)